MDLKIIVIEFYPSTVDIEKKKIIGNLHVTVEMGNLSISLRGIFYSRSGDHHYFGLPHRASTHHKTQAEVKYPILSFGEEIDKAIIEEVQKEGIQFIDNWITSHPEANGLKKQTRFHANAKTKRDKTTPYQVAENRNRAMESKESTTSDRNPKDKLQKIEETLSKPSKAISTKIFVDLPPRKKPQDRLKQKFLLT